MLTFTPEVAAALRWFDITHDVMATDGRVYWQRRSWPGSGGAGDQDPQLLEAMEILRNVHDEIARFMPRKKTTADETENDDTDNNA